MHRPSSQSFSHLEKVGSVFGHGGRPGEVGGLLRGLDGRAGSKKVLPSAAVGLPVLESDRKPQLVGASVDAGHAANAKQVWGFDTDGGDEFLCHRAAGAVPLALERDVDKLRDWHDDDVLVQTCKRPTPIYADKRTRQHLLRNTGIMLYY